MQLFVRSGATRLISVATLSRARPSGERLGWWAAAWAMTVVRNRLWILVRINAERSPKGMIL